MFGMGMGFGMGFFWFIGIAILILIIWTVVKGTNNRNSNSAGKKSALDILKERYARSEINKEEFYEKKKIITEL